MVKEKVEEDYKKIKEDYKAREIEQLCAHGAEAARKFQIYQCCLDWADKLEKIPLLTQDILENNNLIETVYSVENPKGDGDAKWQFFLWLEGQMEEKRKVSYRQCVHSGKGY